MHRRPSKIVIHIYQPGFIHVFSCKFWDIAWKNAGWKYQNDNKVSKMLEKKQTNKKHMWVYMIYFTLYVQNK